MHNTSTLGAGYTLSAEFAAYEKLPAEIREVIREAPFALSAADMRQNRAVMNKLEELGPDGPAWLAEQLMLTYRTKILASSGFSC